MYFFRRDSVKSTAAWLSKREALGERGASSFSSQWHGAASAPRFVQSHAQKMIHTHAVNPDVSRVQLLCHIVEELARGEASRVFNLSTRPPWYGSVDASTLPPTRIDLSRSQVVHGVCTGPAISRRCFESMLTEHLPCLLGAQSYQLSASEEHGDVWTCRVHVRKSRTITEVQFTFVYDAACSAYRLARVQPGLFVVLPLLV